MTAAVARYSSDVLPIAYGLPPAKTQIAQIPSSSSSTQLRPRLVDDLIPYILEVYPSFWDRDYVSLARVSRAWVAPIRKLLYKNPALYTFRACTFLARSLSYNAALIPLVRGLYLYPSTSNSEGGRVTPADTAGLRRLLTIPGLERLSLGGDLAVRAERFLNALASPQTIKHLSIDGSFDCFFHVNRGPHRRASLEWDASLALRFRNLKSLELTDLELEVVSPPAKCILPLETLRLERVSLTGGYLASLARGAWTRLRTLHVTVRKGWEFDEQVRLVLAACAETLEKFEFSTLELDVGGDLNLFGDDPALKFPKLQSVLLGGANVTPEILHQLHTRCSALTTLDVSGRNNLVTPSEWVEMLRNGWWPRLVKLSAPGGTGPPFMFWSETMARPVIEACERRGTDVLCSWVTDEQYASGS